MDDLLENTHRTLGLTLERDEAAALISMLDANGDNSIQCEELEVCLHCASTRPHMLLVYLRCRIWQERDPRDSIEKRIFQPGIALCVTRGRVFYTGLRHCVLDAIRDSIRHVF